MQAHVHPDDILGLLGRSNNHLIVGNLPSCFLTLIPKIRAKIAQCLPDFKLFTKFFSSLNMLNNDKTASNNPRVIVLFNSLLHFLHILIIFLLNLFIVFCLK